MINSRNLIYTNILDLTRYRDDVDEETNIWFEGRGYNIGFIDDVKYNHEYLEIKAEYSRGVDDPNEDN